MENENGEPIQSVNHTPLKRSRIHKDDLIDIEAQYDLYLEPIPLPDDIDIVELVEKVPIEAGKVFDPVTEMIQIREEDRETQKDRLEDYKRKLLFQTEGYGYMYKNLVEMLLDNEGIDTSTLLERYDDYARVFGFPERSRQVVVSALQKLHENKERVKQLKHEKGGSDLLNELFHFKSTGKIELLEGELAIIVIFEQPEEYALAYYDGNSTAEKIKSKSKNSRGFYTFRNGVPIIGINGLNQPDSVFVHERQHMLYDLIEDSTLPASKLIGVSEENETAQNAKYFSDFFLVHRHNAFIRARDEIFAFMTDDKLYGRDIINYLTDQNSDNRLYDYTSDVRHEMTEVYEQYNENTQTLMNSTMERILVREYKDVIKRAVRTFEFMKVNMGSVDAAIGVLRKVPLELWPMVYQSMKKKQADRITDERNARSGIGRIRTFKDIDVSTGNTFDIESLLAKYPPKHYH